jgi:hypothetical protein
MGCCRFSVELSETMHKFLLKNGEQAGFGEFCAGALLTFSFWYAVTAMKHVSLKT